MILKIRRATRRPHASSARIRDSHSQRWRCWFPERVWQTPHMRLTEYAHGGGCACKIPPGELEAITAGLARIHHPSILVGLEHGDDAAAVRLGDNGTALLSTVD